MPDYSTHIKLIGQWCYSQEPPGVQKTSKTPREPRLVVFCRSINIWLSKNLLETYPGISQAYFYCSIIDGSHFMSKNIWSCWNFEIVDGNYAWKFNISQCFLSFLNKQNYKCDFMNKFALIVKLMRVAAGQTTKTKQHWQVPKCTF